MPLYSLKVQTLIARWKHFRSSSSTISVVDAVLQWALYCVCVCVCVCVCGHKMRCDQLFGLGKSRAIAQQPGSGTFGHSTLPQQEKT